MPNIVLGLDIGTSHIKAVSVDRGSAGSAPRLLRYALVPSSGIGAKVFSDSHVDVDQAAELIKAFVLDSGFNIEDKIVAVIPENKVFSKVISMPILEGKEFEEAIKWEAEQHLPSSISDVYLKYTLLEKDETKKASAGDLLSAIRNKVSNTGIGGNKPKASNGEESSSDSEILGTMDVLLVAAQKTLVNRYMDIIKRAGLISLGIEPISISTIRSTLQTDSSIPTLVANLGQNTIDFYYAVDNTLRFVHMTNFGIGSLVKAVAKELDISEIQANEYVFTYGLKESELDGKIRKVILPVMQMIIQELGKTQRYIESRPQFFPHTEVKMVKRVVLAGGGALVPDMMLFMANEIKPEVQYANPWKAVDTSNIKMTPQLHELGPIFAASIGAALK